MRCSCSRHLLYSSFFSVGEPSLHPLEKSLGILYAKSFHTDFICLRRMQGNEWFHRLLYLGVKRRRQVSERRRFEGWNLLDSVLESPGTFDQKRLRLLIWSCEHYDISVAALLKNCLVFGVTHSWNTVLNFGYHLCCRYSEVFQTFCFS